MEISYPYPPNTPGANLENNKYYHGLDIVTSEALRRIQFWVIDSNLDMSQLARFGLHPTLVLLKYLRANHFDCERAISHITHNIHWRKSAHLDELIMETPEKVLGCSLLDITPYFMHCHIGYDRNGCPVIYRKFPLGLFNKNVMNKLASITQIENIINYHIWEMERCIQLCTAKSHELGIIVESIVVIIDLSIDSTSSTDGSSNQNADSSISLAHDQQGDNSGSSDSSSKMFSNPSLSIDYLNMLKKLLFIDQVLYPETIGKVYVINASKTYYYFWEIIMKSVLAVEVSSLIKNHYLFASKLTSSGSKSIAEGDLSSSASNISSGVRSARGLNPNERSNLKPDYGGAEAPGVLSSKKTKMRHFYSSDVNIINKIMFLEGSDMWKPILFEAIGKSNLPVDLGGYLSPISTIKHPYGVRSQNGIYPHDISKPTGYPNQAKNKTFNDEKAKYYKKKLKNNDQISLNKSFGDNLDFEHNNGSNNSSSLVDFPPVDMGIRRRNLSDYADNASLMTDNTDVSKGDATGSGADSDDSSDMLYADAVDPRDIESDRRGAPGDKVTMNISSVSDSSVNELIAVLSQYKLPEDLRRTLKYGKLPNVPEISLQETIGGTGFRDRDLRPYRSHIDSNIFDDEDDGEFDDISDVSDTQSRKARRSSAAYIDGRTNIHYDWSNEIKYFQEIEKKMSIIKASEQISEQDPSASDAPVFKSKKTSANPKISLNLFGEKNSNKNNSNGNNIINSSSNSSGRSRDLISSPVKYFEGGLNEAGDQRSLVVSSPYISDSKTSTNGSNGAAIVEESAGYYSFMCKYILFVIKNTVRMLVSPIVKLRSFINKKSVEELKIYFKWSVWGNIFIAGVAMIMSSYMLASTEFVSAYAEIQMWTGAVFLLISILLILINFAGYYGLSVDNLNLMYFYAYCLGGSAFILFIISLTSILYLALPRRIIYSNNTAKLLLNSKAVDLVISRYNTIVAVGSLVLLIFSITPILISVAISNKQKNLQLKQNYAVLINQEQTVLRVIQLILFVTSFVMLSYGAYSLYYLFEINNIDTLFPIIYGLVYGGMCLLITSIYGLWASKTFHRSVIYYNYRVVVPIIVGLMVICLTISFRTIGLVDTSRRGSVLRTQLLITGVLCCFVSLFQILSFFSSKNLYYLIVCDENDAIAALRSRDSDRKLTNNQRYQIMRLQYISSIRSIEDKILIVWSFLMGIGHIFFIGTYLIFSIFVNGTNDKLIIEEGDIYSFISIWRSIGVIDPKLLENDSYLIVTRIILTFVIGPLLLIYAWSIFVHSPIRRICGITANSIILQFQIVYYAMKIHYKYFTNTSDNSLDHSIKMNFPGFVMYTIVSIGIFLLVPAIILKLEFSEVSKSISQSDTHNFLLFSSNYNNYNKLYKKGREYKQGSIFVPSVIDSTFKNITSRISSVFQFFAGNSSRINSFARTESFEDAGVSEVNDNESNSVVSATDDNDSESHNFEADFDDDSMTDSSYTFSRSSATIDSNSGSTNISGSKMGSNNSKYSGFNGFFTGIQTIFSKKEDEFHSNYQGDDHLASMIESGRFVNKFARGDGSKSNIYSSSNSNSSSSIGEIKKAKRNSFDSIFSDDKNTYNFDTSHNSSSIANKMTIGSFMRIDQMKDHSDRLSDRNLHNQSSSNNNKEGGGKVGRGDSRSQNHSQYNNRVISSISTIKLSQEQSSSGSLAYIY